jgi:hypothetical protein
MATFIGTVIIVIFCCLAMSLGLVFSGKPLSGGCSKKAPGTPRCNACPNRDKKIRQDGHLAGESK